MLLNQVEQWKYWGASRSKYLLLYLNLYFVLFGQLRISGRNRAAPRRTFVHISTSSCNPRGRPYIFAIWWLHTNILYSQEARISICYLHAFVLLCNKNFAKNSKIVIACKISHSFTVPMCDGQAWTISIALASPLMRLQRTMQVTLGRNKYNGDRERRKRGIDWRHNCIEQKHVKHIHDQLSSVIWKV